MPANPRLFPLHKKYGETDTQGRATRARARIDCRGLIDIYDMGKKLKKIKSELIELLRADGRYSESMDPLIEIAAGHALLHRKLLDDIERLHSPVVRENEFVDCSGPDEAVKLLPQTAMDYHNALAAIGLADGFQDNTTPAGRTAKGAAPTSDRDELARVMRIATGIELPNI